MGEPSAVVLSEQLRQYLTPGDVYAEVVPVRLALFAGVTLLVVPSAWLLGEWAGPVGISTAVAGCSVVAVIVSWPVGRDHLHHVAIAAGSVSIVTTVYVLVFGTAIYAAGIKLGPVELVALYLLLAAVARWTNPLRVAVACGAVVWIACTVWVLRLVNYWPPAEPGAGPWPISSVYDLFTVLGHFAASAMFPTVAVAVGAIPRYLAHRRSELVAAVRREQRVELAQDLHDFVAHDLTGIVAQAQAAQFARADDVEHLRRALARIEEVGVGALDTMDGLVNVLHDGDTAPLSMRRIADVPALVERFGAERGGPVRVELDDDLQDRVSRQVQATAYRVVVEGLTNVRRHATPGCRVTVSLGCTPDGSLSVAVLNEVGAAAPADRHRRAHGGTGLTALRERVSAVGGCLEAGPDGNGQWRLQATLPTPQEGGGQ